MKNYLYTSVAALLFALHMPAMAQSTFWTFDENNNEVAIPIQCDGQINENTQTVIMPSVEALYQQGELFLEKDPLTQKNAGYCFLSAAIQGYVPAQYKVAQMYYDGDILPQDNLSAYKWAFLASLNDDKDAEQLALTIEQFLTTEDIELATKSLETQLPDLKAKKSLTVTELDTIATEKQQELDALNTEIDTILGVKYTKPAVKSLSEKRAEEKAIAEAKEAKINETEPKLFSNTKKIFTSDDKL